MRRALKLAGALVLGGFLFNAVVTMLWHPAGSENDHPAIFTEYANSDGWVLTHFAQFLGVAVGLAGLFVLCRALTIRGEVTVLARVAMGLLIATVTGFAILQAVDGITLKQAVDAWADASGPQEEIRFADAETVRWTEWGLQSFFRILLGLSLILVGAAVLVTRVVRGWLGWVAVLAGALSVVVGIDVGYSGLEGDLQDALSSALQILAFIFAIGILVAGTRRPEPAAST